ncbi:phage tail length tape measure family protein [Rhodovulum marinum]|nr:phage tail length tape measure family protein [Rhodovulum marinum]
MEFDADGAIKSVRVAKTEFEKLKTAGVNVSKGLYGTDELMKNLGRNARVSAGAVQNLGYQFNDIGVMMAAGQSPLTLAIQQGTQISQVLGPMGAQGAVTALGDAFKAMINPVSLATIGIVAGTAALGQWAMAAAQGEDATEDFATSVDDLVTAMNALQDITAIYSGSGLVDLKEKYGEVTDQVLALVEAQRQFAVTDAVQSAADAASALKEEFRDVFLELGRTDFVDERRLAWFKREFGLTIGQAQQLRAALDEASQATTFDSQAAALAKVRGILDATTLKTGELYGKLLDAESAMRQLAAQAPQAGWLSAVIGEAKSLASALWDAAKARAAATAEATTDAAGNPTPFGPGSRARSRPERMGFAASEDAIYGPAVRTRQGGAAAAREERDAVAELILSLQGEVDILREADPVKQELIRLREQMVDATDAERAKIEDLIRAKEREINLGQTQKQMWQSLGQTALTALDDMDAAMNMLLRSLREGAFLGSGPLGGLFGGQNASGLGGLFGMMVGGFGGFRASGGSVQPGRAYIVGERGPEPFIPSVPGTILPNSALRQQGSGGTAQFSITVNVNGATGDRELEERAYAGTSRAIEAAFAQYDAERLPLRVREINDQPERIG